MTRARVLNSAKQYYRNNTIPIIVKPDELANVMKCIKAGTTIRASLPQFCWIETQKPAPELFAFKNKLVNVHTGETHDPLRACGSLTLATSTTIFRLNVLAGNSSSKRLIPTTRRRKTASKNNSATA